MSAPVDVLTDVRTRLAAAATTDAARRTRCGVCQAMTPDINRHNVMHGLVPPTSDGQTRCPICDDIAGFHADDCGSGVQVPRHLVLPPKPKAERIRLTADDIARLRSEAAVRRLGGAR